MTVYADVVSYYDAPILVQLNKGPQGSEVPFVIDAAATVKASVISTDHRKTLFGPVTCASNDTGATWATSLVSIPFARTHTDDTTYQGSAVIEISVEEDSVKLAWFVPCSVYRGTITT